MMSTFVAISGTFVAIFSLLGSKKWIIREGGNGISAAGAGAPTARGWKKALGLRTKHSNVAKRTSFQYVELRASHLHRYRDCSPASMSAAGGPCPAVRTAPSQHGRDKRGSVRSNVRKKTVGLIQMGHEYSHFGP